MDNQHKIVEIELQLITSIFNKLQTINAMAIFVKDNERCIFPCNFTNEFDKEMVAIAIREIVIQLDPDIVVYTAEAWSVSTPFKKLPKNIPKPSTHKNRIEIVIVQIEFKTGEKYTCTAKIIRKEDSVKLNDFTISANEQNMGRFIDFYPPKQVH